MNSGKVLLGVMAGVAAGALIGILFAPDKGSKTRKMIVDKGEDYADELKAKFDKLYASMTEKFEGAKKSAEDFSEKGKSKFEEVKKDYKNATSDVRNASM